MRDMTSRASKGTRRGIRWWWEEGNGGKELEGRLELDHIRTITNMIAN
jgi:hypothetical protein